MRLRKDPGWRRDSRSGAGRWGGAQGQECGWSLPADAPRPQAVTSKLRTQTGGGTSQGGGARLVPVAPTGPAAALYGWRGVWGNEIFTGQ